MAMIPDQQDIFFILVVSGGPGAGEFIYDASGNLRSSNVGQATTDPVQGITCPQGFSTFNGHGAVINLLSTSMGAFFQYQDLGTSTQGSLILSVASVSGTDPVTSHTYGAGLTGTDPAFGDQLTAVGANIGLAQVVYTRNANIAAAAGGGATQPKLQLDAPEQTTASHLQMWMTGASPDATKVAQLILGAVVGAGTLTAQTKALLEVQGTTAAPADPVAEIIAKAAGDLSFGIRVSGDTVNRFQVDSNGVIRWGSGGAGVDLDLYRASAGLLQTDNALSVLAGIHAQTGLAGDTNTYQATGRLTKIATSTPQTVNSTTGQAVTGITFPVGIGTYEFEAFLFCTVGPNALVSAAAVIGPATTFASFEIDGMDTKHGSLATALGGGNQTVMGTLTNYVNNGTIPVGDTFTVHIRGRFTTSAAGTVGISVNTTVAANTYTINNGSYATLMASA